MPEAAGRAIHVRAGDVQGVLYLYHDGHVGMPMMMPAITQQALLAAVTLERTATGWELAVGTTGDTYGN